MSKNIIIIIVLIVGLALGSYVVLQSQKSDTDKIAAIGGKSEEEVERPFGEILEDRSASKGTINSSTKTEIISEDNIVEIPLTTTDEIKPGNIISYTGRVVAKGTYTWLAESWGSMFFYVDASDREKFDMGVEEINYNSLCFGGDTESVWESLELGDTPKSCNFTGDVTVVVDKYDVLYKEIGGCQSVRIERVLSVSPPEVTACLD